MVTLAEARELRAMWLAAYKATSTGKAYRTGDGRELTRADADFCLQQFEKWDREVDRIADGRRAGVRIKRIVPRDL